MPEVRLQLVSSARASVESKASYKTLVVRRKVRGQKYLVFRKPTSIFHNGRQKGRNLFYYPFALF